MKKQFLHTLVTALLVAVLFLVLPQNASAAASASLSGSSSVQPGSSVTLTLSVSGSSIYGLSGTLNCGSGLTFTNYSCSASGWTFSSVMLSSSIYRRLMRVVLNLRYLCR